MSSYIGKFKNPKTGKLQECYCIDNFYGSHIYGYGFRKDGKGVNLGNIDFTTCDFYKWKDVKDKN